MHYISRVKIGMGNGYHYEYIIIIAYSYYPGSTLVPNHYAHYFTNIMKKILQLEIIYGLDQTEKILHLVVLFEVSSFWAYSCHDDRSLPLDLNILHI